MVVRKEKAINSPIISRKMGTKTVLFKSLLRVGVCLPTAGVSCKWLVPHRWYIYTREYIYNLSLLVKHYIISKIISN